MAENRQQRRAATKKKPAVRKSRAKPNRFKLLKVELRAVLLEETVTGEPVREHVGEPMVVVGYKGLQDYVEQLPTAVMQYARDFARGTAEATQRLTQDDEPLPAHPPEVSAE